MTDRRLTITHEEGTFLLGRLDDDKYSGVFLTPEYVSRLRQIRHAVERRRADGGNLLDSDALRNLFEVIDRLASTHADQLKTESYPGNQADRTKWPKWKGARGNRPPTP
jgi:hypothetical protein